MHRGKNGFPGEIWNEARSRPGSGAGSMKAGTIWAYLGGLGRRSGWIRIPHERGESFPARRWNRECVLHEEIAVFTSTEFSYRNAWNSSTVSPAWRRIVWRVLGAGFFPECTGTVKMTLRRRRCAPPS